MSMLPVLHLHDRTVQTVPVNPVEAAALAACFGKYAAPKEQERAAAKRLLLHLRDQEAWIACGCREASIQPPPLMSPRLRQGNIHLWRHGASEHSATCPFFVAKGDGEPTSDETSRWKSEWLRLKPVSETPSHPRSKSPHTPPADSTHAAPATPATAAVLHSILEAAGYTTIAPDEVRTQRDKPAVSARRDSYAALDRLRDTPVGGGLTWGNVACSFLPSLNAHLKQLEHLAPRFPVGTRPQGVFVGIVHEIVQASRYEHTLVWRTGKDNERVATATVNGPVHFGTATDARTGPFWVFAQLAQRPGEKRFVPVSAYAQPCLSKSVLLPVDTPRERSTAELLLSQITYWARESALGMAVQLEKPLHDEVSPSAVACRPDFILWLPNGKRVLIEAVSDDKLVEYLKDKVKQHLSMRQLPNVVTLIEHAPGEDNAALARRLTAIVARAGKMEG
jgi:hypothetical protein